MVKLSAVVVAAVIALTGAACSEEPKPGNTEVLSEGLKLPENAGVLVDKVTKVSFAGFVVDPHTQTVVADGEVRGDGWKNPSLPRLDEVQIPENSDQFIDVAFTAEAPTPIPSSGPAVPISANRIFPLPGSEGARVWSKQNCFQIAWGGGVTKEMTLDQCRAAAGGEPVPVNE